jgi:hypothetical protein
MTDSSSAQVNYRRKIVGRTRKVREELDVRTAKAHLHSEKVSGTFTYQVVYGWRLSCGHVVRGEAGQGKNSCNCHYCEWMADGDPLYVRYAKENRDEWEDVGGNETGRAEEES